MIVKCNFSLISNKQNEINRKWVDGEMAFLLKKAEKQKNKQSQTPYWGIGDKIFVAETVS